MTDTPTGAGKTYEPIDTSASKQDATSDTTGAVRYKAAASVSPPHLMRATASYSNTPQIQTMAKAVLYGPYGNSAQVFSARYAVITGQYGNAAQVFSARYATITGQYGDAAMAFAYRYGVISGPYTNVAHAVSTQMASVSVSMSSIVVSKRLEKATLIGIMSDTAQIKVGLRATVVRINYQIGRILNTTLAGISRFTPNTLVGKRLEKAVFVSGMADTTSAKTTLIGSVSRLTGQITTAKAQLLGTVATFSANSIVAKRLELAAFSAATLNAVQNLAVSRASVGIMTPDQALMKMSAVGSVSTFTHNTLLGKRLEMSVVTGSSTNAVVNMDAYVGVIMTMEGKKNARRRHVYVA